MKDKKSHCLANVAILFAETFPITMKNG